MKIKNTLVRTKISKYLKFQISYLINIGKILKKKLKIFEKKIENF